MFRLPEQLIPLLRPVWKYFQRLVRPLEVLDAHTVQAAAQLAITFGPQAAQLVGSVDAQYPDRLHDLGINLRPPYSKELADFIWRYRAIDYHGAVQAANSWEAVVASGGHVGMSLRELKTLLASLQYRDVRSVEFARECARWGVSQDDFDTLQTRWLAALAAIRRESIPFVSLSDGEYRLYRLAKDDPRGIFLGLYTDCCQHPDGAGSSCAWHGHESSDGAFFVVEYRGQIIAQAWAWRRMDHSVGRSILVLDNIEVLGGDPGRKEVVKSLFVRAAQALVGRLGIAQVNVGVGYTDINLAGISPAYGAGYIAPPSGLYSDARTQLVLAGDVREVIQDA